MDLDLTYRVPSFESSLTTVDEGYRIMSHQTSRSPWYVRFSRGGLSEDSEEAIHLSGVSVVKLGGGGAQEK